MIDNSLELEPPSVVLQYCINLNKFMCRDTVGDGKSMKVNLLLIHHSALPYLWHDARWL